MIMVFRQNMLIAHFVLVYTRLIIRGNRHLNDILQIYFLIRTILLVYANIILTICSHIY